MPKTYKTCEIMQQLEYMTEEQIEKGLDHNAIKDYAYILHDKDEDKDGNKKNRTGIYASGLKTACRLKVYVSGLVSRITISTRFAVALVMRWHISRIRMQLKSTSIWKRK